ncbi:hypothetical protein [Leptolyngbya sp. KIOST-1]|uniref:hypothetical protein n=1 Tax=Leptolyngbya sp. KIOST-1 TaxID=1229172 RepID=UPI000565B07A|nr:hypothetical protein [Leptolyngbya sp. KIOST-1]
MSHGTLRLLQGFLGLLKLADWITSLPGLGIMLWIWLNLTLPYDSALALWLTTLVPLLMANHEAVKDRL